MKTCEEWDINLAYWDDPMSLRDAAIISSQGPRRGRCKHRHECDCEQIDALHQHAVRLVMMAVEYLELLDGEDSDAALDARAELVRAVRAEVPDAE